MVLRVRGTRVRGTGPADPLLDAITSENQFASAPVHLYLRV